MTMRTKFLRFNKLPKLDPRANLTPEKERETSSHNQHSHTPFKS